MRARVGRWWRGGLIAAVALSMLLAGCQVLGGTRVEVITPVTSPEPSPPSLAQPTPQPGTTPRSTIRPPQVVLEVRAGRQPGRLGSYCWTAGCADPIGRIVPLQPVSVLPREEVRFTVEGLEPTTLRVLAFAAERGRFQDLPDPTAQAWQDQGLAPVAETTLGGASELPYALDVAPGSYVVEARAEWDATGGPRLHASYGFLLQVEGKAAEQDGVRLGKFSLDLARLREYQGSVDAGHQSWRLDPLFVAMDTGHSVGLDPRDSQFAVVSQEFDQSAATWRAIVRVSQGGQSYEMVLVQPITVGVGGIWVVTEVRQAD